MWVRLPPRAPVFLIEDQCCPKKVRAVQRNCLIEVAPGVEYKVVSELRQEAVGEKFRAARHTLVGRCREYFGPSVRVFAGLSIVGCEWTLWVAKSQGHFQQALANSVPWGSSVIWREHLELVGVSPSFDGSEKATQGRTFSAPRSCAA